MPPHFIETLRKADINISTQGDNIIIAAPATGKHFRIDHINFIANAAVTVQLKDGSTNYGGSYVLQAGQAVVLENSFLNDQGVITTSDAANFTMNLSAPVQVSGFIRYRLYNE